MASRNPSPVQLKVYPLLDLHEGPEKHWHNVLRKTCDLCSVYSAGCTTVMTAKITSSKPNCDLAWSSAGFNPTSHKRTLLKFTLPSFWNGYADSNGGFPANSSKTKTPSAHQSTLTSCPQAWRNTERQFSANTRCSLCGFKIYLSTLGRKLPFSWGNVGVYKCFPALGSWVWWENLFIIMKTIVYHVLNWRNSWWWAMDTAFMDSPWSSLAQSNLECQWLYRCYLWQTWHSPCP